MRILFFGTPEFALPSLRYLLAWPGLTVVGVVTQPDRRRQRGSQILPSPVKALAQAHGLSVWQPERLRNDPLSQAEIQALGADVFVVVAYGQILPPAVLAIPPLGCVNAHGSLLPAYRGAAPIQWALRHGEPETGVTTMLMDAGMDTGPMLLQARTAVPLQENAASLGDRLAQMSAELLVETLEKLQAKVLQPQPQPTDQATYAPLLRKSDFQLDWSRTALDLHNQVRGFYPDCLFYRQGRPIKLLATVPLHSGCTSRLTPQDVALEQTQAEPAVSPGTLVALVRGRGPLVKTGSGLLLLETLQPPGRRPQSGYDFVNGHHLQVGEII